MAVVFKYHAVAVFSDPGRCLGAERYLKRFGGPEQSVEAQGWGGTAWVPEGLSIAPASFSTYYSVFLLNTHWTK